MSERKLHCKALPEKNPFFPGRPGRRFLRFFALLLLFVSFVTFSSSSSFADDKSDNYDVNCKTCAVCACHDRIVQNHKRIRRHVTDEFSRYRTWLVNDWFLDNLLPAMMLMTSQMTTVGIQQVQIIGSFLDAKHQLETQRLFQQLTAKAHKDYHPSEGVCAIGTSVRSLAASERLSDLGQVAFSQRAIQRQLLSGDVVSVEGDISDKKSRLRHFISTNCNKADNGNGLDELCKDSDVKAARKNKDVDYMRTVETALTLDIDFTPEGMEKTADEEDVFALSSNLYGHDVLPKINKSVLANDKGEFRPDAMPLYMDLRSIAAKRSVAQNSFSVITSMKAKGKPESAPYIKRIVKDLGLDDDEVEKYLGKKPSYFAQMEVLTKKIYEDPVFYTELYDKPVNVERKAAAMEAIGLMQDRDIYKSLLRSEIVLAVFLDTLLEKEQDRIGDQITRLKDQGEESKDDIKDSSP